MAWSWLKWSTSAKLTEKYQVKSSRVPPPDEWTKINVEASRRHNTESITIGYIMKDKQAFPLWLLETNGDVYFLVAECLAIREVMVLAIQQIFIGLSLRVTHKWLLIPSMTEYLFQKRLSILWKTLKTISFSKQHRYRVF